MNIFLILSMRYHSKGDVIRYDWSANVNGWNVSIEDFHKKMIEQNITVFNATQGDWTYYITPGDDLNAYEDQMPLFNPSWISGLDANLYYVSVIRCNSRKQFCQVCITLNDWDWGFVSPSKPDQGGVIYMADGQPIKLGTGASDPYITVDVDFIFNYGGTSDFPTFNIKFDDSEYPNIHIIFETTTTLVPKPTRTQTPRPTPTPFVPLCH